jgi:hypothetical protein
MEKKLPVPDYIINIYNKKVDTEIIPSIVNTKNITSEGINTIIKKNDLVWFSSTIYKNVVVYHEGTIKWGQNKVLIYFERIMEDDYRIFILTPKLEYIDLLLIGLNKVYK